MEAVLGNAADAKKAWLEAAIADGTRIDEPAAIDEYSGQFILRIPKSLHKSLAEHSKKEGVSMNQYCVYLLSKNDALEKV
jgi:antitoxin HicB